MAIKNPCELLKRLLSEGSEKPWLEFKHNNCDPDEVGEYVSALANSAMLHDIDRAFLVFGISDKPHEAIGTTVKLNDIKVGGEGFANWLNRLIEPKIMINFHDFECDGKHFAIIEIEPSYHRPVQFKKTEFIRIGEHKKKLSEHTEYERSLWAATSRRTFEDGIAKAHQSVADILTALDVEAMYKLFNEPNPKTDEEKLQRLQAEGLVDDDLEGGFAITNLGALLLANDINAFPTVARKAIRVVRYSGKNRLDSIGELEGKRGYATGFTGLIKYIMGNIKRRELIVDGVRKSVFEYPDIAIREIVANALVHQDFSIAGASPLVEMFQDRIEISNPGVPLLDVDRLIDSPPRSRNEKLARLMRRFGLCEERGSGLDKAVIAVEQDHLPPPSFRKSDGGFISVIYGPRSFKDLTKEERLRAAYQHSVLRHMQGDAMSNTSLRERLLLPDDEYQAVSAIISEAIKDKLIAPVDIKQGRRNAKYLPYWAV